MLRLSQGNALAFGYQNALPPAIVPKYDEIKGHARFDLLFWDAHHVWWDVLGILLVIGATRLLVEEVGPFLWSVTDVLLSVDIFPVRYLVRGYRFPCH